MSERKIVAILFSDIVGYTAMVGKDEARGVAAREKHRRLVETLVSQFDGICREETGDESFATFGSSVEAVRCGVAIQNVLAGNPDLSVRIGIHTGDVLERDGRLIGDAVNIAARLRGEALPGGLLISERVYEDTRNHAGLRATFLGEKELKNVAQPMRVYGLGRSGAGQTDRARSQRSIWMLIGAAALCLVLLAAWGVQNAPWILARLVWGGYAGSYMPGDAKWEAEIAFAETSDGVRIAYGSAGEGPPIVVVVGWFGALESPIGRQMGTNPFSYELVTQHRIIQYDGRGSGLSNRNVRDFSLEAKVRDVEAVVEAAGLERFALYASSAGGQTAIAYTVKHPERVSRIGFYGCFLRVGPTPKEKEKWRAMLAAVRLGWDDDNPGFRQLVTSHFMPEASEFQQKVFNELSRITANPDDVANFMQSVLETDVRRLAPRIRVPVLVAHLRSDELVPFELGREIASLIPGARLEPLEGRNHVFLPGDPGIEKLSATMVAFFAADLEGLGSAGQMR